MSQKERIISSAAEMFLEEGIKSVRMDDIAARLGISKRTLYEMFGDKGDLLEQSVRHHFSGKRNAMKRGAREAGNVFEEIFFILSSVKRDDRDKLLIGNLKKFYPEIYRRLEEEAHCFSYGEFDRLLDRGMAQGLFLPDMNKELALMTLSYAMHALFERRSTVTAAAGISHKEAFEYVVINFFRGLATKKGIEVIDELVIKYREKYNEKRRDEKDVF